MKPSFYSRAVGPWPSSTLRHWLLWSHRQWATQARRLSHTWLPPAQERTCSHIWTVWSSSNSKYSSSSSVSELSANSAFTGLLLQTYLRIKETWGFPGGSVIKNPPANAGDKGLNPGSGRFPGEGSSNSIQYSCLGSPMDRGAWWATVHGVARAGHNLVTKQQKQRRVSLILSPNLV